MKNLFITLTLLICTSLYCQTTKSELLYKDKKYDISISKVDFSSGSKVVWTWTFKNNKYDHIVDLGLIMFINQEEIKQFVENCESFIGLDDNIGQNLVSDKNELSQSNYSISKPEDNHLIFINDVEGKYELFTSAKSFKSFLDSVNKSLEFMDKI